MIEWWFIVASALTGPPEKAPPAPSNAKIATQPPSVKAPKKAAPGKRANKPSPAPPRPRKASPEEVLMLQNKEFLQMLDLLIDLPLLAEDEELETPEKKK